MIFTKYLNPRNDLAFSRIFGSERNQDILVHFLNDIFGRTTNPIETVTFLKTIQNPEIASKRVSTVDILCKDAEHNQFIIEMQVAHQKGFAQRAQYYAAKAYIQQRKRGSKYHELKQVTLLSITNFVLFPDKPAYLSHHAILDQATLTQDLKDFSFSFLELPKFTKKIKQLVTMTEKWAYFFKYAEETTEAELEQLVGDDIILKRAYEELVRFNWKEEELRLYDAIEKKTLDDECILETRLEEAEARGEARGEAQNKIEIARRMHSQGIEISIIRACTGLSEAEILNLICKSSDVN